MKVKTDWLIIRLNDLNIITVPHVISYWKGLAANILAQRPNHDAQTLSVGLKNVRCSIQMN